MRSPSFLALTEEAVRILFRSKSLLWMILPLGILLFGSLRASETLTLSLPTEANATAFLSAWAEHHAAWMVGGGTLLALGMLRTLLRGPLFLMLESRLRKKFPAARAASLGKKALFRGALLALLFETGYWSLLLLFGLVIFSPLLFALTFNPSAVLSLFHMGSLFLLVLAVVFFSIKEFSLLYSLLGPVAPRLSVELGLKLFQKHTALSLLFGLYLIALSFLFTFFLNLAMITSAFMPFPFWEAGLKAAAGILILGFAALLTETLRLLMFHALATTPRIKMELGKKILAKEKETTGAPTV